MLSDKADDRLTYLKVMMNILWRSAHSISVRSEAALFARLRQYSTDLASPLPFARGLSTILSRYSGELNIV